MAQIYVTAARETPAYVECNLGSVATADVQ